MTKVISHCALAALVALPLSSVANDAPRDVSWQAKAEIARRGPMVERVAGTGESDDASAAVAAAMQPPPDDSHKWHFTLVVTRNCQWCERARRDFETDERLKAWVDTKDHGKSWAHWQVVQIEDPSQAWRWKDFRPTAFPTLIVQPPMNGSWGDAHTIVVARQGYLAPVELDTALRKAIQAYAAKTFPRHRAWEAASSIAMRRPSQGGNEQASTAQGYNPPVPAPVPLPPVPSTPANTYPNIPPHSPVSDASAAVLLAQLLGSLLGGPMLANLLLIAILAWHIYRGIAKREGIPLLLDDETAAQLTDFVRALRDSSSQAPGEKKTN